MTQTSTPMEEIWRAFLFDHMGKDTPSTSTYDDLKVFEKVYTDMPRKDVNRDNFPRMKVQELVSPRHLLPASGMWQYDANLTILVFNDMDVTKDISGTTVSPEVLNARLGTLVSDTIEDYWQTGLFTGSTPFSINTISYNRAGIDNEYFKRLDVYKGIVEINGIFWR